MKIFKMYFVYVWLCSGLRRRGGCQAYSCEFLPVLTLNRLFFVILVSLGFNLFIYLWQFMLKKLFNFFFTHFSLMELFTLLWQACFVKKVFKIHFCLFFINIAFLWVEIFKSFFSFRLHSFFTWKIICLYFGFMKPFPLRKTTYFLDNFFFINFYQKSPTWMS